MGKPPFIFIKGLDTSKLVKKQIIDSTGKKTTRWVDPNQKQPQEKQPSKIEVKHKKEGTINEFNTIKKEFEPQLNMHKATLDATISEMKKAFPNAKVYGRVKDVDSAADKVFIKRSQGRKGYGPQDLQDLTGTRIESDSIEDVFKSVAKLRKMYDIIEEDNYIDQPKGIGYRRYHCICKDKNGKVFEVQLGTKNQTIWADWCHDVYKPQTETQASVFNKYKENVMEYAQKTAEYFYAKDTGKKPVPNVPPCEFEIKEAFGCLPIN